MIYKISDKKSSGNGVTTEPNYQLANELHRDIIRKIKKRKVYSFFIGNIWGVDLADIQSLICLVTMHGLFLCKIKEESLLLMYFKK